MNLDEGQQNGSFLVWAALFLLALTYAVGYFPGIEWHSGYLGNAYQSIHPDSFPNDEFMPLNRPTMMSSFYKTIHYAGEIVLDDRVTIVFYFLFVVLALWIVDKTGRLLGLSSVAERICLMSIMILEHRFRDNHASLVSRWDFNPTTVAGPVVLALIYLVLKKQRDWRFFALAVLLCSISVKNAWFVLLMGAAAFFIEDLSSRRRWIFGSMGAAAVAVFFFVYHAKFQGPHDVALFDYIVGMMDNSEANPFMDTLGANVLFLVLCAAVFFVRLNDRILESRVRTVAAVSAGAWFFGGLYLSYAPNAMKIPLLVPFDVNRSLQWGQYVFFVAFVVSLLLAARKSSGMRTAVPLMAGLVALYLLPPKINVVLALGIGFWAAAALFFNKPSLRRPGNFATFAALVFFIASVSFHSMKAVKRRHAYQFLFRHGVLGDAPGATWVGVDSYIRDHMPKTASVLAFSEAEYPDGTSRLSQDFGLRTRTGRKMFGAHNANFYFDYDMLMRNVERNRFLDKLSAELNAGNYKLFSEALSELKYPDVIVVPKREGDALLAVDKIHYHLNSSIGAYDILTK